jgi:predicted ATPase
MKHFTKKHLLIGAPGTGKSSTLNYISNLGYCCFPEVARKITLSAKENGVEQLFLTDPLAFSKALLKGRITQFKNADSAKEDLVFIDRGIPDISAYLDYSQQNYPPEFAEANTQYIYHKVFHFPIWDDIYISDNERYESLVEAKRIDIYLQNTYKSLGYELIHVPKSTIQERAAFILQHQKN